MQVCKYASILISIHAPYKGCNAKPLQTGQLNAGISIHAPYKGCNTPPGTNLPFANPFQSMHPIKDATDILDFRLLCILHFNPCTL